MFAAHRDVFRVLFSMAQLDPDAVGGAVHRLEERGPGDGPPRATAGRAGPPARRRDGRAAANPDLAARELRRFDLLYTGRGLSVDEIVELFTTTPSARSTPEENACGAAAP